ncbi:MAG TPA: hypothetical protein VK638_33710 [Edaphobacter sp.]|nr:hypothetical protein [Edaphobacter sp.]
MPAKKKPANTSRSETVTVRLDPKIRYIAELAARHQQRTLSSFIEWAVRQVLMKGDVLEEPNYGSDHEGERQIRPMWGEGFWDVDEADRFFLLAVGRPDLLTITEQRLWKLYSSSLPGNHGELNITRFREYWNDSSVSSNAKTKGKSK